MGIQDFVDSYSLRARVAPAILVLLPVVLAASTWVPQDASLGAVPIGAVVTFGSVALLSQLGRDAGKRIEPALFASWGGSPTTDLLSFARSTLNPQTLVRMHRVLHDRLPALPLDSTSEARDPALADQTYESASEWLQERTRDRNVFPLLFEENVNYGLRRNLWGMKPLGVVLSLAGAGISVARVIYVVATAAGSVVASVIFAAVSLGFLILWIGVVRPNWVRVAAVAYAQRLVGTVETIQ